jgi:phosphohistidine swiveling domain-containing protein
MTSPLAVHLPRFSSHTPPPGVWVRETHTDAPVAAFVEPMLAAFGRGFERGFAHWGFPLAGMGRAVIDGWLYLCSEDLSDADELARRIERVEHVGDLTELRRTAREWQADVLPSVDAARRSIAPSPLETYSPDELADALVAVYSLLVDFAERRMAAVAGTNLLTSAFLVDGAEAGMSRAECLAALAGGSHATAARSRDAGGANGASGEALDEYIDDLLSADGSVPVAGGGLPAAGGAAPVARECTVAVPAQLTPTLADARLAHDVREASRQQFMRLLGRARRIANELGSRLVDGGSLDAADDTSYMTPDEIVAVHTGSLPAASAKALVRSRRHDVEVAAARVPDAVVGAPIVRDAPPAPPAELGAGAMRVLVLAMSWLSSMGADGAAAPTSQDGNLLRGVPASPGVVTAPVRVVRHVDDVLLVEPGEILVCGMTTPAWCVAISISAGLISTGGGDCSHSAIAAREFAIPAVVGVVSAMDVLRTGDIVTLDGTNGVVTLQPA